MTEPLEETIVIRLSKTDRQLLDRISHQDGDASISAVLRGLVRQEARNRGLSGTFNLEDTAATLN